MSDELKAAQFIAVEVAYALPQQQVLLQLKVSPGTTVEDAIQKSGVLAQFPEIDLINSNRVGIFSKPVPLDTVLREKDRIEIYRPLIADPKEVRRQRAKSGKRVKDET